MQPFDLTKGDAAWLLAFFLAIVALVKIGRSEHRWAKYAAYRIPRHFVRLALTGLMTLRYLTGLHWIPRPGEPIIDLFMVRMTPQCLPMTAAAVVGMHFLLWKGDRARRFWHARLERIGLRPGDL